MIHKGATLALFLCCGPTVLDSREIFGRAQAAISNSAAGLAVQQRVRCRPSLVRLLQKRMRLEGQYGSYFSTQLEQAGAHGRPRLRVLVKRNVGPNMVNVVVVLVKKRQSQQPGVCACE